MTYQIKIATDKAIKTANRMLRPCPFCGGAAEVVIETDACYDGEDGFYIQCKECPCSFGLWCGNIGETGYFSMPQEAADSWNKDKT